MNRSLFIVFFLAISLSGFAQKIVLEGTYQGKNVFVQNPEADEKGSFCTERVIVNGSEIRIQNTNAYEIKLDSLGFKLDDTIKIEIMHKAGCKPKVITPNYTPKGNFDIVSISVDFNSVLHWISKNEIHPLPYTVEQYRWNKWVKIGEVEGKGGMEENAYSFQTKPHSGQNKFRVKQVASGKTRLSATAEFEVPDLNIEIIGDAQKLADVIEFNQETMYELYDRYGNLVRKGYGKTIDIKGLERNFYYLNYDNKSAKTVTKFW